MKTETFHFSKVDSKHPDEDSMLAQDGIFCVADGITLSFYKDIYPNPSPSKEVSELIVKTIHQEIKAQKSKKIKALTTAFKKANLEVKNYNESLNINKKTLNFLDKQYIGATCAFAFEDKNIFYYAQLNDCGIMVFDPLGNREVDFILNIKPFVGYLNNKKEIKKELSDKKLEHIFIRKNMVNNLKIEHEGVKVNFGVVTGENKVSKLLRFGASNITTGQMALLYTDGFIPFVYDNDFVKILMKQDFKEEANAFIKSKASENNKYNKEKSLIVVKFE